MWQSLYSIGGCPGCSGCILEYISVCARVHHLSTATSYTLSQLVLCPLAFNRLVRLDSQNTHHALLYFMVDPGAGFKCTSCFGRLANAHCSRFCCLQCRPIRHSSKPDFSLVQLNRTKVPCHQTRQDYCENRVTHLSVTPDSRSSSRTSDSLS